MDYTYLNRNVAHVRCELAEAARAGGYDPAGVTLMAAVKSADVGEINYIHRELGIHAVGENRVQQLLERYEALDREGLEIHFIGTLQTNKVKYIIDKVTMIQSLDSERLAQEIERQAARHGVRMDVLVEINSGMEASKGGILPTEAAAFAERITNGDFPHMRLRGFMTMAPRSTEAEYHAYFAATRRLCTGIWDDLVRRGHVEGEPILSMGMSESYVPAAAEGATLVRVGRGLFVHETEPTERTTRDPMNGSAGDP